MKERQPFQKEAPGVSHSLLVRSPVFKAIVDILPDDFEALTGRDVPMPLLLNLSKQPRLNQGTSEIANSSSPIHSNVHRKCIND